VDSKTRGGDSQGVRVRDLVFGRVRLFHDHLGQTAKTWPVKCLKAVASLLPGTRCLPPTALRIAGPVIEKGRRKRDEKDEGSGTGPILLSQAAFLLAHISN